mgnify:CR=1 FL=1
MKLNHFVYILLAAYLATFLRLTLDNNFFTSIIGSLENQLANSISPTMGIFFCAAFNTISESFGMPGDTIHRSAS